MGSGHEDEGFINFYGFQPIFFKSRKQKIYTIDKGYVIIMRING